MTLQFHPGFFSTRNEVLADIASQGFWPMTFVSGPSEGLEVHWHDHDVRGYVVEGATDFLDAETGVRTPVQAGDLVVVPAGTLHAEGKVVDRVVYILATPEAMPADRFLVLRAPEELKSST